MIKALHSKLKLEPRKP